MNTGLTGGDVHLTPEMRSNLSLALVVALALYGISYMRHAGEGHFIDAIDLAIHETGHLVFGFFGDIVAAAGGTLFQLAASLPVATPAGDADLADEQPRVGAPLRGTIRPPGT